MTLMETARQKWVTAVIPIQYQDKRPEIPWKEFQARATEPQELDRWFATGDHNIAVVTGHRGLTVIDFDDMHTWHDWLRFCEKNEKAAIVQRKTYQVQTSKGRHVYIRLPEATKSRPLTKPDGTRWGIDIKSRGGYVLAPPSVHPDGTQYRALNSNHPMFVSALSDILPPDMLTQVEFQPRGKPARKQAADIWDHVMNPVSLGPGTVDRIKAAYSLEDILPVMQVTGSKHYLTRCPLHDDHNPSMWVDTDQQICGCYAGCTTKPLDFINLYARIHDLSNGEAIRELARGI